MPRINIYEHSDTYSFQVRNKAYACVAFPITAIWGPVYDAADEDTNPDWLHFEAGFRGTTDFVNTFRGANTALGAREKSYDYALKLLAAGYDILVKRADGTGSRAGRDLIFDAPAATAVKAGATIAITTTSETQSTYPSQSITATAKVPGTFGNKLKVWVDFANFASDAELDVTEPESWKLKADFRQQATVRIYMAGSTQSGIDCMTIKPEDVLLEAHVITYTYDSGALAAKTVTLTDSEFVESIELNAACLNRYPDRDSWIMTLGVTATATVGTATWSQTLTATGAGDSTFGLLTINAKYPGSFGNQLKVRVKVSNDVNGRKIGTVEVFSRNGYTDHSTEIVRTDQLLEIQSVAFDINAATDAQPYITEAVFSTLGVINIQHEELLANGSYVVSLLGGTDYATIGNGIDVTTKAIDVQIMEMVQSRFTSDSASFPLYIRDLVGNSTTTPPTAGSASQEQVIQIWNQQKVFLNASAMIGELTDPLTYDWDALFMGIADDQYIPQSWQEAHPEVTVQYEPTSTHLTLLEVAANSKCGAAFIGTPFGMKRGTYNEVTHTKTGAVKFKDDLSAMAGASLSTFGELVGPWCKTTLPINGANSWITPELAHLLLIINAQGVGGQNKWWMVPAGMMGTGVAHSPEYRIKKAYLDIIQDHDEGVCMNPLMQVPGKGFTCFGNSTLWDKPLGTYNALQNLSTRLLTNRVKQRIWDTALQILFKYNNENAYSHFYAGVSPLLDEMRAVGALTGTEANPWGYKIIMNPDIINLDRINANTVIGRVELAVTGVIDTVDVDLFLLPPTAFQTEV